MDSDTHPHTLEFYVSNQSDIAVETGNFKAIVTSVLKGERVKASSFTIVLLSRDALRNMKNDFFNLDVYTDVIAFNLNDEDEDLEGELYISPEQIAFNAKEFGVSFQNELHRVVIHGTLHCCGWEDETPDLKAKMHKREDHYLKRIK